MNIKALIKSLPFVKTIQQTRYENRFLSATRSNLFYGVYNSFAAANTATPTTKPTGYDNQASAELYSERNDKIYPTDYPSLFWLAKILAPNHHLFEIGGHTGVSFYSYQKLLEFPENLTWTILEVPSVVEQGRKIALDRHEKRLNFTISPEGTLPSVDVLVATGSMQYLDKPLSAIITELGSTPQHVILNLLPVTTLDTYYTVQNIGTAFCPYKIIHRDQLINDLQTLGYRLIDEWQNPEKKCFIPYSDPAHSLNHYCGFYFQRPD